MANLSKRLKDIFNSYLERLEEEKHRPKETTYRPPYHQRNFFNEGIDDDFDGIIYFYEWSNLKVAPRAFYTFSAFESFANKSLIFLAAYQKELIKHMPASYITCKRDSTELIIKNDYDKLKTSFEESCGESSNPFHSTGAPGFIPPSTKGSEEPYNVTITRPPFSPLSRRSPMYREPEGRWSDEMHPEVGGCWGW